MYSTSTFNVSVIGRDKGCTINYTPSLEGVPKGKDEGTPEGKGLYLTIYTESSSHMDSISF